MRSLIIHPHTDTDDEELDDLVAILDRHPAVGRVEWFTWDGDKSTRRDKAAGMGAQVDELHERYGATPQRPRYMGGDRD